MPLFPRQQRARAIAALNIALLVPLAFAGDFSTLAAQADAARESNQVPQAIDLYRQAVRLDSTWQQGWFYLGTLLYDSRQYPSARDAFRALLRLHPEAPPALAFLGLCDYETGDYGEALTSLQAALQSNTGMDPQLEPVLRYHAGLLLTKGGKFEAALAAYSWFVQKGSKSAQLAVALGLAALRAPMLPKDLNQEQTKLYSAAGVVAYSMLAGDVPTAAKGMTELITAFPSAHYLHYLYGSFLMSMNPGAAAGEFRKELQITPESADANAMLAWALLNYDEYGEALPYAAKAVALDVQNPTAQYTLGVALSETGNYRESIGHLELAAKADSGDVKTLTALATAYSRAGKPIEARREREIVGELAKRVSTSASP